MDNTKVYVNDKGERLYQPLPNCKCGNTMTLSMTVKRVDVFQCPDCDRLFIMNFEKQTMAWFIADDNSQSKVAVVKKERKENDEAEK